MLSKEIMYKALLEKDSSFEGSFIAAVKTTRIFCRPTCTARKPKAENVEFYETCKEAILNGYRPCKICLPMEMMGETPQYIKELLQQINIDFSVKIKDYQLTLKGYEPNKVRRWFKKHHGMTFQAYQRMMRLNNAMNKIQSGTHVTNAAFESGYESLSGFSDYLKSVFGAPPTKSKSKNIISLTRIETPIGPMLAGATDKGLCLLEFTDRWMLETELKDLTKYFNAVILPGENTLFPMLRQQLNEYFNGSLQSFSVPLDTPGTEFQKKVWEQLLKIPFGKTVSYKTQAIAMKQPLAVRAVANANGHNRVSIIIPCHRVIGENGNLTGYGGGLSRKRWLLVHEQKFSNNGCLF